MEFHLTKTTRVTKLMHFNLDKIREEAIKNSRIQGKIQSTNIVITQKGFFIMSLFEEMHEWHTMNSVWLLGTKSSEDFSAKIAIDVDLQLFYSTKQSKSYYRLRYWLRFAEDKYKICEKIWTIAGGKTTGWIFIFSIHNQEYIFCTNIL